MMSCFDLSILEVFDQYCFGPFFGHLLRAEMYCDLLEMILDVRWKMLDL